MPGLPKLALSVLAHRSCRLTGVPAEVVGRDRAAADGFVVEGREVVADHEAGAGRAAAGARRRRWWCVKPSAPNAGAVTGGDRKRFCRGAGVQRDRTGAGVDGWAQTPVIVPILFRECRLCRS